MLRWRKRQKVGKAISAQRVNYGVDARTILDGITVVPPLEMIWHQNGFVIRLGGTPIPQELTGIASGTITARVSSTPGVGFASITTLMYDTGSGLPALLDTGNIVAVANTSNIAYASGKYVKMRTQNGIYEVFDGDCPA